MLQGVLRGRRSKFETRNVCVARMRCSGGVSMVSNEEGIQSNHCLYQRKMGGFEDRGGISLEEAGAVLLEDTPASQHSWTFHFPLSGVVAPRSGSFIVLQPLRGRACFTRCRLRQCCSKWDLSEISTIRRKRKT